MIGLVIVAHGRLAQEFRAALEHVLGPQSQLETVSVGPTDCAFDRRADIAAAVRAVDAGSGVVIVSDLFGGTPCNTATSITHTTPVEVICGVNLPMLVQLAQNRMQKDVLPLALDAQTAGRKYITIASQVYAARSGAA